MRSWCYRIKNAIKKALILVLIGLLTVNPFFVAGVLADDGLDSTQFPLSSPEQVDVPLPSSSPDSNEVSVQQTGSLAVVSENETQVNTTLISSEIEVSTVPIASDGANAVSPFTLSPPSPLPSEGPPTQSPPTPNPAPTQVTVNNQAVVETQTSASAISGENEQNVSGNTEMTTGDTTAIATTLSLVNTTMIDSTLQVGVIAILNAWNGDIVVDPIYRNTLPMSNNYSQNIEINNTETAVDSITEAKAITGDNAQSATGSASMTTGSAMAISENNVIVNETMIGVDIFTLLTENLWLWSGNILNWSSPGSIQDAGAISNSVDRTDTGCNENCTGEIKINNQAEVKTSTIAEATSGRNSQSTSGNAEMTTGSAKAGAISTTMVNTTMINSRYRQLSLLMFAPWSGNLVFAYPDLEIFAAAQEEVVEGEDIHYQIRVRNRGYAKSIGIHLNESITNDNQVIYENGNEWSELEASETVLQDFAISTKDLGGGVVTLTAKVSGTNEEESNLNNFVAVKTTILKKNVNPEPKNDEVQTIQNPQLSLNSKNNIHEFVYPGDGVTYDMIASNEGPSESRNVLLLQDFYTPSGELIGRFSGEVGSLVESQRKNIRFVIQTGNELSAGDYYTESYLVGESSQGVKIKSNTVTNSVIIKARTLTATKIPKTVDALSPEQEQILGTAIGGKHCNNCVSFPWYVAITLGSMTYYITTSKRRDYAKAIKWGLALPLAAYAGLLWSNQSCAHTYTLLPGAGIGCILFLPISYGIYLGIMTLGRASENMVKYFRQKNLNISQ